jgi:DNA-directed RNA polymerase specialized sigma subunit
MKQNIMKNYDALVREHFENLPDKKKIVVGKVLNVAHDQPHIYTQVGDQKIMVEHGHIIHHVAPKEKEAPTGQLVVPPEDPEERRIFNQKMADHRFWNDDKAQYEKQLKEEQEKKNKYYQELAEAKKDEPTKLIEKHLDYSSKLANDFYRRTYYVFKGFVEHNDIQQSAFLGLVQAAQNFDPAKKAEFTTYAHPFVMNELRNIKNYFQNSAKISEYLIRRITRLENDIEKTTFIPAEKLKEIKSYAGEMSVSLSKQFSKNPEIVEKERKRIAKDIETAMVDEYYEQEKKKLGELPSVTHLESAEAEQKIEAKSEIRNRRVNALLGSIISEDYDSVMRELSKFLSVKERLAMKLRVWGWDYGEIGRFLKEYHASGGQVPQIMEKITPKIKGAAIEKITSIPANYFFKHEMQSAPDPDVMKRTHSLTPEMKKVYEARYDKDGKPRTGGIRGVAEKLGVTYHVAKRRLSELEKHTSGDAETSFINTAKDHIIGQNFVTSARKKIEENRDSMARLVKKSYLFLGTKKGGSDEKIHLTLMI